MPEKEIEYGLLIEKELSPFDWIAGGVSAAEKVVLREDGNFSNFLPDVEYQSGTYFDTMACVTFSALNNLEILAKVLGIGGWNKSDRFTAKQSGTSKRGNYLSVVADSVRMNHGAVDEPVWPYPREQREPVFEWEDFYAAIPAEIQALGLEFVKEYKINWEWVPVARVREMLKYGPMQVTVQAWPKANAQGLYENREAGRDYNHAVTLFNATDGYFEIYDHYQKSTKRLVPTYKFGSALQFTLSKRLPAPMPTLKLKNNILVMDAEDTGAFGMHLDGKILLGPNGDVLATAFMRAPRKTIDGVSFALLEDPKPLKKADWDSFPKFNLKNQPIEE